MLNGGERIGEATAAVKSWPHQVRTFERLYDKWPPKLLIADEVGLGKTIDVDLFLRQAWLAGKVRRVLGTDRVDWSQNRPGTWVTVDNGWRIWRIRRCAMPWKKTTPMTERLNFIELYHTRLWSMTELCTRFGISRKTGYKWLGRYVQEGL
jgi:hypothetical protein